MGGANPELWHQSTPMEEEVEAHSKTTCLFSDTQLPDRWAWQPVFRKADLPFCPNLLSP